MTFEISSRILSKLFRHVFFAMLGATAPALAESSDLYAIQNIRVDVTAKSAVAAQEQAIDEGRNAAFKELLSRLLSPQDLERIRSIAPQDSENLILDYEVVSQKNSAVRYIATLNFRFDPQAVKNWLQKKKVSQVKKPRAPLVILPILIHQGKPVLWDDENPWLLAWAQQPFDKAQHPFIIPMGDAADLGSLTIEQALNDDPEALTALAQRYKASGAVVAIAEKSPTPKGSSQLYIRLFVQQTGQPISSPSIELKMPEMSNEEGLYSAAIQKVIHSLEQKASPVEEAPSLEAAPPSQKIIATIYHHGFKDWLTLQKKLKAASGVQQLKITSLARNEASIEINYAGSMRYLVSVFQTLGFHVEPQGDARWIITRQEHPARIPDIS